MDSVKLIASSEEWKLNWLKQISSFYNDASQDVENYDPILNPVLNRELRRTGGRVLISLGDQDIDLSPSFTIFLTTRDPNVSFCDWTGAYLFTCDLGSSFFFFLYLHVCTWAFLKKVMDK